MRALNGLDLNNQKATNVADPSANTDAANKQYVDNVARGLDWKQEVVAASTANVTLASPGTTLDGVTLSNGDRVLLKNQTAPAENGIYVFNGGASALTRALDADTWAELTGSTVTIQRGTVNADTVYRVNSDDGGTLGTTAVTLAQVGGGSSYTAGNGLTLTGSTFDVVPGTGLTVGADVVSIDTSVVTRKYAAACVATTNPQTFNHNLSSSDVTVAVREVSTGALVLADVTVVDVNSVSVNFGGAPTAGQYRVVVHA